MLCLGIWLSVRYLKIADLFINFTTPEGISFADLGAQYLIDIIIYIAIIFPGILILLNAINKRW